MKTLIVDAFNQALTKFNAHYINKRQKLRLFTLYNRPENQEINSLSFSLANSITDNDALTIIVLYLQSEKNHLHHKFKDYLLNELKNKIPQIDWDAIGLGVIKFFNGLLFRSSGTPPLQAFQNGFHEHESSPINEKYLKFRNHHVGISTTKNFNCAKFYAKKIRAHGAQSYIYKINYRGNKGFDLIETGRERGLHFNPLFHADRFLGLFKQEVNIKGHLDKEDIIGAWEQQNNDQFLWHENPYYQPTRNNKYTPEVFRC